MRTVTTATDRRAPGRDGRGGGVPTEPGAPIRPVPLAWCPRPGRTAPAPHSGSGLHPRGPPPPPPRASAPPQTKRGGTGREGEGGGRSTPRPGCVVRRGCGTKPGGGGDRHGPKVGGSALSPPHRSAGSPSVEVSFVTHVLRSFDATHIHWVAIRRPISFGVHSGGRRSALLPPRDGAYGYHCDPPQPLRRVSEPEGPRLRRPCHRSPPAAAALTFADLQVSPRGDRPGPSLPSPPAR